MDKRAGGGEPGGRVVGEAGPRVRAEVLKRRTAWLWNPRKERKGKE